MFTKMTKKRTFAALLAMILVLSSMLVSCGEKKIEDPKELFEYAEMKAIDEMFDSFADEYDEYLEEVNNPKAGGGVSSIDIELSEEALGMLGLAANMDLSWLSNIGLDVEAYADKDVVSSKFSLLLGESRLADIMMLIDSSDSSIYLSAPEVLNKALMIKGNEAASIATDEIFKALPDGKTLGTLVKKYVEIFVKGIEKVEKSEGTLTANGVTENCTVVKATLTEVDAINIVKKITETAKEDADLKDLIVGIGNVISGIPGAEVESGEALYNDFAEELQWKLDDINEMDNEPSDELEAIIFTDYINSKNEIIGRTISNDTGELISLGIAEKDGSFGFELKVEEELLLRGEGKSGKTMNGTYIIGNGIDDIAEIVLKDIEADLSKGTIDIKVLEMPDIDGAEMLSGFLAVYSLSITFDVSKDEADMRISVMNGEDEFAAINIEGKTKKVEKIEVDTTDAIIIDENLDASALMGALDLSALIENLKNSPIPAELVSLLEMYLAMAN